MVSYSIRVCRNPPPQFVHVWVVGNYVFPVAASLSEHIQADIEKNVYNVMFTVEHNVVFHSLVIRFYIC